METWILKIVDAGGGGDSAHVSDMLHHGRKGDGDDGDDGGHDEAPVRIAENGDGGVLLSWGD